MKRTTTVQIEIESKLAAKEVETALIKAGWASGLTVNDSEVISETVHMELTPEEVALVEEFRNPTTPDAIYPANLQIGDTIEVQGCEYVAVTLPVLSRPGGSYYYELDVTDGGTPVKLAIRDTSLVRLVRRLGKGNQ